MRPVDVKDRLQKLADSDTKDAEYIKKRLEAAIDALGENGLYYDSQEAQVHIHVFTPRSDSREETFYMLCAELAQLLEDQIDNLSAEGDPEEPDLEDCRSQSLDRLRETFKDLKMQSMTDKVLFDPDAIPSNHTVVEAIKDNS